MTKHAINCLVFCWTPATTVMCLRFMTLPTIVHLNAAGCYNGVGEGHQRLQCQLVRCELLSHGKRCSQALARQHLSGQAKHPAARMSSEPADAVCWLQDHLNYINEATLVPILPHLLPPPYEGASVHAVRHCRAAGCTHVQIYRQLSSSAG